MPETDEPSAEAATAIHLDTVGGIAGDMFAAAMLDVLPSLWPICKRAIAAMAPPAGVEPSLIDYSDGVLRGCRFLVAGVHEQHDHVGHHAHAHSHDHAHGHHAWREIRQRLEASDLSDAERVAAIGIFTDLAKAEAAVHGIGVDDVSFHEVGAWDSIIDIVAAAAIIAQVPQCRWTVSSLPRGRGQVRSAHGMLPLPAPATVELLKGYALYDDGEDGERITPTGAAILNYLAPSQEADPIPRVLIGTGTGFGTKRFQNRSNILRVTLYGAVTSTRETTTDAVEVLRCEIDDQTPEDLAIALDHVRGDARVLDACQWPVFSKKGRMATAVQVLVQQGGGDAVTRIILDETTTLGVRRMIADRHVVERDLTVADGVNVKLAKRPSAKTAKAEARDLVDVTTHAQRENMRGQAERAALRQNEGRDDE